MEGTVTRRWLWLSLASDHTAWVAQLPEGQPLPMQFWGLTLSFWKPFLGKIKNNTWDEKRLVPGTSRSTVHLEQPCKHAGSSVRWVTVMDRRKSSATAASEQTALVIRLEM